MGLEKTGDQSLKSAFFFVESNKAAGEYDEAIFVELSTKAKTPIYYTLDGSEPTSNSLQYKEPIFLWKDGTTEIKAVVIVDNDTHGETFTGKYIINIGKNIKKKLDNATRKKAEEYIQQFVSTNIPEFADVRQIKDISWLVGIGTQPYLPLESSAFKNFSINKLNVSEEEKAFFREMNNSGYGRFLSVEDINRYIFDEINPNAVINDKNKLPQRAMVSLKEGILIDDKSGYVWIPVDGGDNTVFFPVS